MNRAITSNWFSYVMVGFAAGYLWAHFDRLNDVLTGLNIAASTGLNIAWWN
jgi:hypothetical protein